MKYLYDFQQFQIIRFFGDSNFGGKIRLSETDKKIIFQKTSEFSRKARSRQKADKKKKIDTFESANALYEGQEFTCIAFKSGIFS